MMPFEQKLWRVVARPWVKVILILTWPLGATVGLLIVTRNDLLHNAAPFISILGIALSTLGAITVTVYFQSQVRWGVPTAVTLSLHRLYSVLILAYFSSTCLVLKYLYGWTFLDLLTPRHLLPTRELYPVANLAYLGLFLSLVEGLAVLWRTRDYRLTTTIDLD